MNTVPVLQPIADKENIPDHTLTSSPPRKPKELESQRLQVEIRRLQKLYSDEVVSNQSTLQEQERLELDLLAKEKELLAQQKKYAQIAQLNVELNEKLTHEAHCFELEVTKHKIQYQKMLQELEDINNRIKEHTKELQRKDKEIEDLHDEMSGLYRELAAKEAEVTELTRTGTKSTIPHHTQYSDNEELIEDESDSDLSSSTTKKEKEEEEEEEEELLQDSDDDLDIIRPNTNESLAQELRTASNLNKLLLRYRFELKSLKNERTQLLNYVNKLLKNKPCEDQNEVLKDKLVNRKILRIASINYDQDSDNKDDNMPGHIHLKQRRKRVVSNYVDLKSYSSQRLTQTTISENNDTKEQLIGELKSLGQDVGHQLYVGSATRYLEKLKPTLIFGVLSGRPGEAEFEIEELNDSVN